MKIIILGDVAASETNVRAFCEAEKDLFSPEVQSICADANTVILNLEKPLTDIISPLGKCPPDFAAPTDTIQGILLLHPDVVTLANNHIMDQCEQGLQSTRDILVRNGIQFVGVGDNELEAREPVIISKEGFRIGIYACCEKEFSFATKTKAGANAFDALETFDDITELRNKCDYLIVLFHGGMQDYPYPTPYQQRVCRKMCQKGADLVVCQHSHIIGCEEIYDGGRIIYGQGNFILDETIDDETINQNWHAGLMIEVSIDRNDSAIRYIPVQTKDHKVILHPDSRSVMATFMERSREISEEKAAEILFSDFSNRNLSNYLVKLSGKTRFIQRVFRRLGITKIYGKLYPKDVCNMILDYFYCDSHRESIEYGLQNLVQNKEKHQDRGIK